MNKKLRKEYYFIAILLILFILLTMFVIGGKTNLIDEKVFNNIIKIKSNSITRVLYVITQLASTIGILSITIATMLIFLKKKRLSDFKYVIINVLSSVVLMKILKDIIKRSRPTWKWIVQGGFSYPSGHTISALVLYGTLILLISKRLNNRYKKPLIIMLSILIILTGISRIYFGAHYLTDVVASILLGTIILIISNIFMNKEFDNDRDKTKKSVQIK